MREITFVHPTSKLIRTIKVCETQKEIVDVIRKRRIFEDGSIFVLYNNGGSFYQLLGSDGWKAGQFRSFGIKNATVSSFSGELFVFGDFAITPDGLVCIGEENIKKYGSYSGQYDFQPEKFETKTETKTETKAETTITIDKIRQAYNKAIDDIKHNYFIDEECRQAVICSKIKQLDFINYLWEHGPYNYDVISSYPEAAIRFALYLLGR